MAQIALAWLRHEDWVDAPIVGTTSVEHLEQAVEATDIGLTDSELEYLEESYEPMEVFGTGERGFRRNHNETGAERSRGASNRGSEGSREGESTVTRAGRPQTLSVVRVN